MLTRRIKSQAGPRSLSVRRGFRRGALVYLYHHNINEVWYSPHIIPETPRTKYADSFVHHHFLRSRSAPDEVSRIFCKNDTPLGYLCFVCFTTLTLTIVINCPDIQLDRSGLVIIRCMEYWSCFLAYNTVATKCLSIPSLNSCMLEITYGYEWMWWTGSSELKEFPAFGGLPVSRGLLKLTFPRFDAPVLLLI